MNENDIRLIFVLLFILATIATYDREEKTICAVCAFVWTGSVYAMYDFPITSGWFWLGCAISIPMSIQITINAVMAALAVHKWKKSFRLFRA